MDDALGDEHNSFAAQPSSHSQTLHTLGTVTALFSADSWLDHNPRAAGVQKRGHLNQLLL